MCIRAGSPPFRPSALGSVWVGNITLSTPIAMPSRSLPFSLKKLRRKVDKLDRFVKSAVIDTMELELTTNDLGCPSTVVDELAHLHGLLDLACCCVTEIDVCTR